MHVNRWVVLGLLWFIPQLLWSQRDLDRGDMTPRQEAGKLLDKGYCDDSYGIYARLYGRDSLNSDFLGMAQSNTCRKKFEDAERQYRWLIQKDTNYIPALYSFARHFLAQSNEDSALQYFRLYITGMERRIRETGVGESDPRAWLYIGNIYRVRMHKKGISDKEWIAMMSAYERYLQLKPNEPAQYQLRMFMEKVTEKRPDPDGVLIWDERS